MSCSNCFNGCAEIVSDKCVRYTGIDVPVLGIQTGDSLSYVEQALIEFLTSTLDGTGIKPDINPLIICTVVQKYLPTCGDITVVDLINALIKAACDLQVQITALDAELTIVQQQIAVIEAPYTIGCLTGVTTTSGTHAILQAVITKLCAFILDVETNYVQLADLDALIQAYLDSLSSSTKFYTKMVPFTVVEFSGDPTGKFDVTGAGLGDWEKIYLCNGLNGTPDKRGRVTVGTTSGMGGGPFNSAVDPAIPGNPAYSLGTTTGSNTITLSTGQIPSHTHIATATVSDPGHTHDYVGVDTVLTAGGSSSSRRCGDFTKTSFSAVTGISVGVVNAPIGGGGSHPNIQPVIAAHYIMYIP
jgi:microcystin-dependent protein